MTFRAQGRARRLAGLFEVPVAFPTGIMKGLFGGNLGIPFMATCAFLRLRTLLVRVMALLAVLQRIGMLLVPELNPLVHIRFVKPGILDGERILLTEDALQDEQGSQEQNCSNSGNNCSLHGTPASFLPYYFFHKVQANHNKNNHVVKQKIRDFCEKLALCC